MVWWWSEQACCFFLKKLDKKAGLVVDHLVDYTQLMGRRAKAAKNLHPITIDHFCIQFNSKTILYLYSVKYI
jgi:hypothetical protein